MVRWWLEVWQARRELRQQPPVEPFPELIAWTLSVFLLIIIMTVCWEG